MNTDNLITALNRYHPVSDNLAAAILQATTSLSFPKNYCLLEAPKIAAHAYFLEQGFAMSYSYVNGKKHIEHFWAPNQFIISVKSFFEQVGATEHIQLLADSTVTCMSHTNAMRLFATYPEALFLYKKIVHHYYEHSRERLRDMHLLSAAQRYVKLIRTLPALETYAHQAHIASYLGIKSQSLSRIKKYKADF